MAVLPGRTGDDAERTAARASRPVKGGSRRCCLRPCALASNKFITMERDRDGFYVLLGVGPDATQAEIDAAYEKALKASVGPGMGFIRRAAEQAYGVIGKPAMRALYDPAWTPPGEPPRTAPTRASPSPAPLTQFRGSEGDADVYAFPGAYSHAVPPAVAPQRKSSGCLGVVLLFVGLLLLFR